MLSRLTLTNFQSWDKLDLELSPVVVIVGETDSGKSAILRALSAVLFNSLEGSSFVKKGAARARVEITTDGHVVALERSAAVNRYLVDDRVYDKVGREVPDAVSDVLQVKEVVFEEGGSLTLQFQPQMDAPFLLTDQGVRATRLLGSVSKVAALYRAARSAAGRSTKADSESQLAHTATEQCQQRFESYDWVSTIAPEIQAFRELLNRHSDRQQKLDEIRALAEQQGKLASALGGLTEQYLAGASRVRVFSRLVAIREQIHAAEQVQQNLQEARMRSNELRRKEMAARIRLTAAGDDLAQLERLETLKAALSVADAHRAVVEKLAGLTAAQMAAETHVATLVQQVAVLEQDVLCPTCGRAQV